MILDTTGFGRYELRFGSWMVLLDESGADTPYSISRAAWVGLGLWLRQTGELD